MRFKKLFPLLILLFLVSCESDTKVTDYSKIVYEENPTEPYRPRRASRVDKFIFEGHRYIMFSDNFDGSYKGHAGVVHDPECECFKRDEQK